MEQAAEVKRLGVLQRQVALVTAAPPWWESQQFEYMPTNYNNTSFVHSDDLYDASNYQY